MIKDILRKAIGITGYEFSKIQNFNDEELYRKLFSKESVENRRFYNISAGGHIDFGCGIHHPLWTNIDVDRPWKNGVQYNPARDIAHDLLTLTPLPVETSTAEVVYSRVSIEHITDEAALMMFKEVKRILKPGGFFRIITPDINIDYRAFVNNDIDYFFWAKGYSIEQAFLAHFAHGASPTSSEPALEKISDEKFRALFKQMDFEDALNYCTAKCNTPKDPQQRGHHINWWNPAKLEKMLRLAGFTTMYLSAAEQSACPVLRNEHYFDNVFQKCMLYMEAIKTE